MILNRLQNCFFPYNDIERLGKVLKYSSCLMFYVKIFTDFFPPDWTEQCKQYISEHEYLFISYKVYVSSQMSAEYIAQARWEN